MNLFQPKTWLVGGSFTIQSQLCIRTPHSQNFNNACHPVQDVPTLVDSLWIWYHIQYVIIQRHCILLSCGILSYYSKLNTSPSHQVVVSIVLFSHYGVVVRNSFLRPSYLATHNLCIYIFLRNRWKSLMSTYVCQEKIKFKIIQMWSKIKPVNPCGNSKTVAKLVQNWTHFNEKYTRYAVLGSHVAWGVCITVCICNGIVSQSISGAKILRIKCMSFRPTVFAHIVGPASTTDLFLAADWAPSVAERFVWFPFVCAYIAYMKSQIYK